MSFSCTAEDADDMRSRCRAALLRARGGVTPVT